MGKLDLKLKALTTLFFMLIFIVLGFYFIISSNSIKPNPEFPDYELTFRLETEPPFTVNYFTIYFDFKINKGNISFWPNTNDLRLIIIEVPKELSFDESNIILHNRRGHVYKENIDYDITLDDIVCGEINDTCKHSIRIEGKSNLSDVNEVVVGIKGDSFYPHGVFRMDTTEKTMAGYLHSFMVFKLGDFECIDNCIVDFNGNIGYLLEGNRLRIYLKNKTDAVSNRWFIINTINQRNVTKKQIWVALAVSLFVSGVVLFVETFILFIELICKPRLYLNINTKKYHYRDCQHVNEGMVSKKITLKCAEKKGYTFCRSCVHNFRK